MWRKHLPRIGAWTFVAVLIVVGMGATYPGGGWQFAADVCNYRSNSDRVDEANQRKQSLEHAEAVVRERVEGKEALCEQLVRGEVSLSDAAAMYLSLYNGDESELAPFRRVVPGSTDQERAAANIIRQAFDSPNATSTVRADLLASFRTHFGTDYPFSTDLFEDRQ